MRPRTPDRLLEIYLADQSAASPAGVAPARFTAEDELVLLGELRKALEAQPNSEVMGSGGDA